jgi:hypothetical protein
MSRTEININLFTSYLHAKNDYLYIDYRKRVGRAPPDTT